MNVFTAPRGRLRFRVRYEAAFVLSRKQVSMFGDMRFCTAKAIRNLINSPFLVLDEFESLK